MIIKKPTYSFLSNFAIITLLAFSFLVSNSCKKETIYGVTDTPVLDNSADKDKLKSEEQFVAIVNVNLFQVPMSSNELLEVTNLIASIGDKQAIHEVVVSNMMNESDVLIPSVQEMRDDPEAFVNETYRRFMIRFPSELEKTWMLNYIEANDDVTPELIYFGFASSNEYNFY